MTGLTAEQRNQQAENLIIAVENFRTMYNERPVIVTACIGGSDEHYQLFRAEDLATSEPMPVFTANYESTWFHG